jgi:hypothetical protein
MIPGSAGGEENGRVREALPLGVSRHPAAFHRMLAVPLPLHLPWEASMALLKAKQSISRAVPIPVLADFAFLLLIFFLVTTIGHEDRSLQPALPENGDEVPIGPDHLPIASFVRTVDAWKQLSVDPQYSMR